MATAEPVSSVLVITSAPTAVPGKKSGNLSNSDFRALVTNPGDGAEDSRLDALARKKLKKNTRLESYKKWQKRKEKYKEKQVIKYRDRAKERRDELNPDYKNVEHYESVSIEKSKFLGGDIEHTHLVKGLDFALANKMREEDERKEEERLEKEFREKEKEKLKGAQPAKIEPKKKQSIQFLTAMGRTVHRLAVENVGNVGKPLEHFIPGRMTYEFDLDENFSQEIPTTVLQSKADLPRDEDRVTGLVDLAIRKKVEKIMKFLRQGTLAVKGKKKRNTRERKKTMMRLLQHQKMKN